MINRNDDPILDERIIELVGSTEGSISPHDVAVTLGEHPGPVQNSLRRLHKEGLVDEVQAGHRYTATDLGRTRANEVRAVVAAAIVAELQEEQQAELRAERDAIVAAAGDVMDVANGEKIATLLGRSSDPMSPQLLGATIGEDAATVDQICKGLIARKLIERTDSGAYVSTPKNRESCGDLSPKEVQALFASDRDAIVAAVGADMALDPADVVFHEAMELQEQEYAGLVASRRGGVTRYLTPAEDALSQALKISDRATARYMSTMDPDDGRKAIAAAQAVRVRLAVLRASKDGRGGK